ncbi:ketoacyl-synt-domain-containing protein [Corynespora cassiicola Philippines]|uniref:Ketoacyl-synt-domain-containing protein n=1 Tax=Corynespora cassiicola Philippines TaxID=1448308 RepID=A0A2T2N043_CORCC|nr:ketoacyl-synt-domain-containing protein [Corynespora cassiicola Philippines]
MAIAIIGVGCRFPGGANSQDLLWDLLESEKSAWTTVPATRWREDAFRHASPELQGMHNHAGGHFIDQDIAAFDGSFFGLSASECEAVDPQQRLQLEVAYEALENAGISLEKVAGSNTAVYVATFSSDYNLLQHKDVQDIPKYHTTGVGAAIVANRISYLFDLRGLSVAMDTGCSGSLVAIHQACQSLKSGECDMAIAGGVNLMLSPDQMVTMSPMRCWSDQGRCFSFDDRGTGYGRGEGAAAIVLKRLDDAIQNGDPIRAVIRNSGVNQDGKTQGIMVPKADAQTQLIRSVYQAVDLDPRETAFVEAHGTGTAIGDPAEVESIRSAFGSARDSMALSIGSIKPNIGHLEAASGVASVIKGVLMLERGQVLPTTGIRSLKRDLRLEENGISIPRKLTAWPENKQRRLSVNSFGYGGTNAHAILEAAPDAQPDKSVQRGYGKPNGGRSDILYPRVIPLCAKSQRSAAQLRENMKIWCRKQMEAGTDSIEALHDLAFTLSAGRSQMQYRMSFVASSFPEVLSRLEDSATEPVRAMPHPRAIFVFTGQGAQWYAMGRELLLSSSPFLRSINKSEMVLRDLGSAWSLIEELCRPEHETRINDSEISQPTTTALQLALVDLMADIAIKPEAVVGHSSGEIAAAYAAGALDRRSALTVAYLRGRVCTEAILPAGAMIAVALGSARTNDYLTAAKRGNAVVACVNSPKSCTISGDKTAIDDIESRLMADGIHVRRLVVDRAYHSHHMEAIASQYLRLLSGLNHGSADQGVSFVSSVTGLPKRSHFGPEYWVANLVSQVRFQEALVRVFEDRPSLLVDVGPHNALSGPVRQTLAETRRNGVVGLYGSLLRGQNALHSFAQLCASLYEQGYAVHLGRHATMFGPQRPPAILTSLPPYPWDHSRRHWHESRQSKAHRFRKHPYHELLGIAVPGQVFPRPVWRHFVDSTRISWLREHVIDGDAVFPASAFICMTIEGLRQIHSDGGARKAVSYSFRNIDFIMPLIVPASGQAIELELHILPVYGLKWEDFHIVAIDHDGVATEYCRGSLLAELEQSGNDIEDYHEHSDSLRLASRRFDRLRRPGSEIDVGGFYHRLRQGGNAYGPTFASLKSLRLDDEIALAYSCIPEIAQTMPVALAQEHAIHPTTLDAMFHPSIALFERVAKGSTIVVSHIESLRVSAAARTTPGTAMANYTELEEAEAQACTTRAQIFQGRQRKEARPVVEIRGLKLQSLTPASDEGNEICYEFEWGLDVDFISNADLAHPLRQSVAEAQASKLQELNQGAAFYLNRCLKTVDEAAAVQLSHGQAKLLQWMKRFRSSDEYSRLARSTPDVDSAMPTKPNPSLGIEGRVLSRIGPQLASILFGKTDPFALLVEDDLFWNMYSDDASNRCYEAAVKYMRHLIFKKPTMAVLEIGAGTAGATEPMLEALAAEPSFPFASYDFTDVSSAFFERARKRLGRWGDRIVFRTLDIEQDVVAQGFPEHSFDLVFASNVLHVAECVSRSLSNIRRLLKPDGRIVMIETVKNVPFYNACLGVLPGWWAGYGDGRRDGPFLSKQQWDDALTQTGFSGTEVVVDDFEEDTHRCALIVSRAISNTDGQETASVPIEIVLAPAWSRRGSQLCTDLASSLGAIGSSVTTNDLAGGAKLPTERLGILIDDGAAPVLESKDELLFKTVTDVVAGHRQLLWVSVQEERAWAVNPAKGLVAGFAQVARAENTALHLITLDVQDAICAPQCISALVKVIHRVIETAFRGAPQRRSVEQDYVYKRGQLYIRRIVPCGPRPLENSHQLQPFHQQNQPLSLSIEKSQSRQRVLFCQRDGFPTELPPTDVEVRVEACGVNFKDSLVAGGHAKKKLEMAGEFAGTVMGVGNEMKEAFKEGDRVCGFGATPYASTVRVRGSAVGRIPPTMSCTTAASIPVVYATCYHALVEQAQLQKGQTVLIHAAAGGVGQAAVAIAKWIGAEVFATAGTAAKRRFLEESLGICRSHIFSSRSESLRECIMHSSQGRGVDVVLNSLTGQSLQDSLECVAQFGTFIELGKADAHANVRVSMAALDLGIKIIALDMAMVYEHRPETVGQLLRKVLSLVVEGKLHPVCPVSVLPICKIGEALSAIQTRAHMGKIVLDASPGQFVETVPAHPQLVLGGETTFVIAGGLGGIGLEIAKRMAIRGARHILLISRRRLSLEQESRTKSMFLRWQVNVQMLSADITKGPAFQAMLSAKLQNMPPVGGVVQSAAALQSRILTEMNVDDFSTAIAPKLNGTNNLKEALEGHPLQFFLLLSSVVGTVVGTIGDANYAAGNASMNYFTSVESCSDTRFIALCAGAVEDVGLLAESRGAKEALYKQGFPAQPVENVLRLMERALMEEKTGQQNRVLVAGFDYSSLQASSNNHLLNTPAFSHLLRTRPDDSLPTSAMTVPASLSGDASGANFEAMAVIEMTNKLKVLLAVESELSLSEHSLASLGIDSLGVVELKNWIAQTFQAKIRNAEIMAASSVKKLAELVVTRSALVGLSR